jgi:dihydrofolate reductase
MSTVLSSASTSLDGYIALPDDSVGPLFDWYSSGEVEVPTAVPGMVFRMTPTSAEYWRAWTADVRVVVVGRRLFDYTGGWGGAHPLGVPVIVVTHRPPTDWPHPDAPFHFIGDLGEAISRARELAGEGTVSVAAGTLAGQCLSAGLLDAVAMDLVPVVLGAGRPYFASSGHSVTRLGDPTTVVQSDRVTHLVFPTAR